MLTFEANLHDINNCIWSLNCLIDDFEQFEPQACHAIITDLKETRKKLESIKRLME